MNEKMKLALEKLEQNEELKKQVEQNPPKSLEELKALLRELGVTLTDEEIKASKKLSADDLDKVAGGAGLVGKYDRCADFWNAIACTIFGI